MFHMKQSLPALFFFLICLSSAQAIENRIAHFSILDKIIGEITALEIPINKSLRFGSLDITVHTCQTRPLKELPQTTSFLEIFDTSFNDLRTQVFRGWMFAQSPALSALDHPVYDVWLIACSTPIEESDIFKKSNKRYTQQ